MRRLSLLLPLFLFAACGGHHALDGHWNQSMPGGKKGMTLEFNTKSSECMVHTAPDDTGHHDHGDGTYTFDESSGMVTIKMKLPAAPAAVEWKGQLKAGKLDLSSADGKLEFVKGAAAH